MLTTEELVLALVNNLADWDWSVYPKFSIDEDTAKAVIKEYWKSKESK